MTKKILVADDSITIQKIVAMAFEKEDAVVEGVSNGKDAFEKIPDFQPDIVLADIDMPGLTGFELSKKIKNDPNFNSTKILLLASDFEDFNNDLFKASSADGHISKPFKSEDIIKRVVDLLSEDISGSTNQTNKLDSEILEETTEAQKTTFELSSDNLIKKDNATIQLTSEDLQKTSGPNAVDQSASKGTTGKAQEDDLDAMINDIESLKEKTNLIDTDHNELSDVDPTREDIIGDELDTAFQDIVKFGLGKESGDTPSFESESINDSSDLEVIIPEPENLLEKMSPSKLAGKSDNSSLNLIQDSLSYFSQISHEPKFRKVKAAHRNERLKDLSQLTDAGVDSILAEHVKQIVENSLNSIIENEIASLSKSIAKSVQEVVREITPKIARDVIREEIGKIKKP